VNAILKASYVCINNLGDFEMIDLQQKLIKNAMVFDRKTLFQRNTKLTEELGELGEAVVLNDREEMIEETIDVMLVAISVHLDLSDAFDVLNNNVNQAFNEKRFSPSENITMDFITLTGYVGRFAEAIQKYSNVATSSYKGTVTKQDVIDRIDKVIAQCALLIAMQTSDDKMVNEIIHRKNSKWLNYAKKGFILADVNQVVNIEKGSNIVIEFREQLKATANVNAVFIDYEQIAHRVTDLRDIESIVQIDEQYSDKRDIVVFTNVPFNVADKLMNIKTSFKIISFVK
jgi:NTP pyrophosphatase (non-canonical NTP hydrolase)